MPINLRHYLRKRAALCQTRIDVLDSALDFILPSLICLIISACLTPLQKRSRQSQLLLVRKAQSLLRDLG